MGALAFTTAPALAAAGHEFSGEFNGGVGHELSDPTGIAVNNATGNVYVVDKGNNRIEEFNPMGTKLEAEFNGSGTPGKLSEPEAIAVDNSIGVGDPSRGDVYVTDHNVVDKFSSSGAYLGQIAGTCEKKGEAPEITSSCSGHGTFTAFAPVDGVAVDLQGVVWVYQGERARNGIGYIDAYSDAQPNAYLSSRESKASYEPSPGLAVDSEDDLYVAHTVEYPVIAKLNSAGEVLRPPGEALGGEEQKTGVAVEPSSNDVYIDSEPTESGEPAEIEEFAPDATKPTERFGAEQLAGNVGGALTVSEAGVSAGDVYVLDPSAGKVDVFTPPKVTAHVFSSSFSGSIVSPLSEPTGVAVNNETGDVYVVDKGNNRVVELNSTGTAVLAEFNGAAAPTGAFSKPEAIAVDNSGDSAADPSAGDVYVTDNGHGVVDKFSKSGAYLGQIAGTCENAGEAPPLCGSFAGFSRLLGVAVDAGGAVWISQDSQAETSSEIDAFSNEEPNGFLSRREPQTGQADRFPLPGLGVDSEDNLYVTILRGTDENLVAKFDSEGEALEKEHEEDFGGQPLGQRTGIAVDLSTDDVLLDYGSSVSEYTASGSPIETFGSGHLTKGSGLAVNFSSDNAASGTVYVTDTAANDVDIFNAYPLPQVAVGAVSGLTAASVTLEGSIDPEGREVSSCEFEYGTTTSYGQTAACEPAADSLGKGSEPVLVKAKLSGLPSGTTYHYRLVASNTIGTNRGSDHEVTTPGPSITEERVTYVEAMDATLQAQIDPNGSATSYHFEYDTSPYGEGEGPHGTRLPVPSVSVGSGTSAVPVSIRAQDLQPGTTYHYRAVAEGEPLGAPESFYGPAQTFTTREGAGTAAETCPNAQRRAEQPFGLGLPDCRAYEMVSPVNTEGQNATEEEYDQRARAAEEGAPAQPTTASTSAQEGGAVTYVASGTFSGTSTEPTGATLENQYVSRRDPEHDGWTTQAVTPLHDPDNTEDIGSYTRDAFNPQLTEGIADTNAPLTEGASREFALYAANFLNGSYRYISDEFPALPRGVSSDLSRVVFGDKGKTYEWAGGTPFPVGVDNEDEVVPASVAGWRAVSGTGSDVAFMRNGQLYVRVNTGQVQSHVEQPESEGSGTLTQGSKIVGGLITASGATVLTNNAGSTELEVTPIDGRFVVGELVSGSGIEAGTTIVAIQEDAPPPQETLPEPEEILTLSKPTEGEPGGSVLSSGGPLPFVVGDRVSGAGVPAGATVTATAEGSLTLSVAASASGSGVQLVEGGGCTEPADACTVEASASRREAENPAGVQPVQYWGASVDGSKVFFSSKAELTEDAYTGPAGEGSNLYEYEPATNTLTDLTASDHSGAGADVQGVVGISEDGSYVYFVADGALAGEAHEGEPNLYVIHDGGEPAFIATLGGEDNQVWDTSLESNLASLSPNGQWLAFLSKASLTGYDNTPVRESECNGELAFTCQEAYLYDASSGRLVCASCNPTGARPVGPSNLGEQREGPSLYRPRVVTDEGRLFFGSFDKLVRGANGLQNVYEYEDGDVYAISNVSGGYDSFLLDTSASGGDVFFATSDQLLPQDKSNNVVVYDARVDGGFPISPAAPSCDSGDSCKPPPSAQPSVFGPTGSATFNGVGNFAAPATAVVTPKKKTAAQIKAEKLAKALKTCRTKKNKQKRQACEKQARAKYGATKSKTKKAKKATTNRRAQS